MFFLLYKILDSRAGDFNYGKIFTVSLFYFYTGAEFCFQHNPFM